jgi:phosphoenolpyruvate-protein kinase (PTS system EI component)
MTFDSLTFARRLKSAGFTEAQAEALADANRELMVPDLATKGDIAAVRADMGALKQELLAAIDALGLRMTIRLGAMIGVAVAILGAILRLH